MSRREHLQGLSLGLLQGGVSRERDVSLASGKAVLSELRSAGYSPRVIDPAEHRWWQQAAGLDLVFNALHGPMGEDGVVQGMLECLGVVCTGSGVLGSALAMDKQRSKQIWHACGLPTPNYRLVESIEEAHSLIAEWDGFFLKPVLEGSSIGVSCVRNEADLTSAWSRARECAGPILAEAIVDGPEYTVAVLGDRALPAIRITAAEEFYDYTAKYETETTRYHVPCGLDERQETELKELALAAFRTLGCSIWGRVDVMADADAKLQLLEVNTIPGMTDHSLVPKAAQAADIPMIDLLEEVLDLSWIDARSGGTV
ncbi:MAG: D-alanine--D-alanine ligase [Pseudomonadota bacterium]